MTDYSKEHLVIVRSYGEIINLNTYNCQEIGLAKALVKKGMNVTFLMPDNDFGTDIISTENGIINIAHVKIKWKLHNRYCWFYKLESLLNSLKPTIVQVHDMDLLMTWRTVRWAKKRNISCFLIQGPYDKWKAIGFRQLNEIYNRTFGRYIIKNVKGIGVKTNLASLYLNQYEKCNTYPIVIGLDTDAFNNANDVDWRIKLGLGNKKVLLYVGSLQPRRNPFFLLDVVKSLPSDYVLLMVGSGVQENEIKQKVLDEHLEEKCIMLGKLNQRDLPSLYKTADCFLLASDYEILGMVIMESMYFGIPVISTRTTGAEFIISSGIDGFILNNKNKKEWCNCIQTLLSDSLKYQLISQAAKETIKKRFVWDKTCNGFLELYYR